MIRFLSISTLISLRVFFLTLIVPPLMEKNIFLMTLFWLQNFDDVFLFPFLSCLPRALFIIMIHDLENSGREQLRLHHQHCAEHADGLAARLDDVELLLCRGQHARPLVENFQHFHDESNAHHRSREDFRVSCVFAEVLIKVCIHCNRHRTSMAAENVFEYLGNVRNYCGCVQFN